MKAMEPELEELIRNSSSLTDAARKLGIHPSTLSKNLKRRGITDATMYQGILKSQPTKLQDKEQS